MGLFKTRNEPEPVNVVEETGDYREPWPASNTFGPREPIEADVEVHTDVSGTYEVPVEDESGNLPGMWDQSDLSGGEADLTANVVSEATDPRPGPDAPGQPSQVQEDPTEGRGEAIPEQAPEPQDGQDGAETPVAGPKPARKRAPRVQSYKPCACSEFRDEDGNGTGCTANVNSKRTFAPGHDAKLASFLVKLGREDKGVVRVPTPAEDGTEYEHQNLDAKSAAAMFGDAYLTKVTKSLEKPAKSSTKRERQSSADEAGMVEVTSDVRHATIKVGLFTHQAIVNADGSAEYTGSDGPVTVAFGDYEEVDENYRPEPGPESDGWN